MTSTEESADGMLPPRWLDAIVDAVRDLDADDLSRLVPPPPESARPSAVLLLFAESVAGPDLVLIERAHHLRDHAGQLAFPGGGADGDETPAQTALREAQEEIGLDPAGVDVLGVLPALWVPPTNFAVSCVLGWWRQESPVGVVDAVEVADVLRVPLAELADPARRVTVVHPSGYRGPGFEITTGVGAEVVPPVLWGFTAGVVDRILQHAGLARPWDPSRIVPAPGLPDPEGRR